MFSGSMVQFLKYNVAMTPQPLVFVLELAFGIVTKANILSVFVYGFANITCCHCGLFITLLLKTVVSL